MKKLLSVFCVFCVLLGSSLAFSQDITEYKVGEYTIYGLPENNMTANTGILLNTSDDEIKKFFKEKNFTMYLNTFIIRGPKQTILVDSGFGNRLFKHLEVLRISPNEIDTILLTHLHGDHIGGLLQDNKIAFPKANIWLAKQEFDYWTDKDIQVNLPENKQKGFVLAQKTLAAYGDKINAFNPDPIQKQSEPLWSGVRAVAAFGHTPGHTAFMVGEGEDALLIWADLMHVENIQLINPNVAVVFDVNPKQAVETRINLLDYIANNKIKIAGMHLGRSGASMLQKQGSGYELIEAKE